MRPKPKEIQSWAAKVMCIIGGCYPAPEIKGMAAANDAKAEENAGKVVNPESLSNPANEMLPFGSSF